MNSEDKFRAIFAALLSTGKYGPSYEGYNNFRYQQLAKDVQELLAFQEKTIRELTKPGNYG